MQDFSYFHESFSLKKISSYMLQIQLSKFGIGYVVTDAIRNQHVAIKNKPFDNIKEDIFVNFQNAVKEDVYLNKHYKSVSLLFVSEKNTLIPIQYFNKKYLKDYFKFNFVLSEKEEMHFNHLKKAKAYNIYSVPSVLVDFLVNHFPEVRLYHHTTPYIRSAFKAVDGAVGAFDYVRVCFCNDFMNISVIKNQKLIFLNNFNFCSDEDAVFYIMTVMDKLSIKLNKASFSVLGTIEKGSKLHKYLLKYISEVKFVERFDREFPFKQVPAHVYANILDFEVQYK